MAWSSFSYVDFPTQSSTLSLWSNKQPKSGLAKTWPRQTRLRSIAFFQKLKNRLNKPRNFFKKELKQFIPSNPWLDQVFHTLIFRHKVPHCLCARINAKIWAGPNMAKADQAKPRNFFKKIKKKSIRSNPWLGQVFHTLIFRHKVPLFLCARINSQNLGLPTHGLGKKFFFEKKIEKIHTVESMA